METPFWFELAGCRWLLSPQLPPVGPEHRSSYLTPSVLLIVMRGPSNLRKALSLMIYAEDLLCVPLQPFSLVL